jgi:hypothetical protein
MTTSAPSWAKRSAIARPIPKLLPVTRAIFPASLILTSIAVFVYRIIYCFVIPGRTPGILSRIRYTLVWAVKYKVLPSSSPHAIL